MKPAKPSKLTQRGLGDAEGALPEDPEGELVPSKRVGVNAPESSGRLPAASVAAEPAPSRRPDPAVKATSRAPAAYAPPHRETRAMPLPGKDAGIPRRETSRMAACIDEIGPATAAIAAGRARYATPCRVALTGEAARVPLDPRDAAVLGLIDDKLSLRSVVDRSGMPENDVVTILDRLARLAIITLE